MHMISLCQLDDFPVCISAMRVVTYWWFVRATCVVDGRFLGTFFGSMRNSVHTHEFTRGGDIQVVWNVQGVGDQTLGN